MVCVADHFEPMRGIDAGSIGSVEKGREKVREWRSRYLKAVEGVRDADGRPPQHTFFYPQEEYDAACLEQLSEMCAEGAGEVEIHLHHRHDTAEGFRDKLIHFRDRLHR
jgi:hypothetical protein